MNTESPEREAISKALEESGVSFDDENNATQEATPEPKEDPDFAEVPDSPEDKQAESSQGEQKSPKSPEGKNDPAPEVPQQAAPAEDAPQFWKQEHKALWNKIPPEAHKIIKEYEAGRNKLAAQLKQAVNEKIGQWQSANFTESFPPERLNALKRENITPGQATESLWAWHDYLEESPIDAIRELMDRYEIDLDTLGNPHHQPAYQPQQSFTDPRVDELIANNERQQQEIQTAHIKRQLDVFGAELGQNNTPLRPYWNEVKPYIKQNLPLVYSENPDISDYDALHKAYEIAVYANPSTRAKLNNTAQPTKFDAEKTQRAKEAASSLSSSSSRTAEQPKKAKSVRDAIEMAWDENTGRR